MNKLYDIQLPNEEFCNIDEMYFRGKNITYNLNRVEIHQYGSILFDTYYNAFSIEKWNKYTDLNSLYFHIKIQGLCRITIYNKVMQAGDFITKIVKRINVGNSDDYIDLSGCFNLKGILAIGIESFSKEIVLSDMYYATNDFGEQTKLAIGICTFKREQYIEKFIENFQKVENSITNIEAFISDNAKSLYASTNPKIHIFKNKNYGGSGGFGRCMYEIRKENIKNKAGFTHIILMDDDIFIDFHIFEKINAFLSFLKFEYRLYFLAGAMCSLDMPWLQYEKYSGFNGINLRQFGANFDLRNKDIVVLNERDEKIGPASAAWWCSCFSTEMLTPNNFPFPCFFRGDDVEFTLRNQSKIITLNGINVWHEPFYKKYSISSENYYFMRNILIINALYFPHLSFKQSANMLRKRFINAIFTYDYDGGALLIRALKDFSKGISFFLSENYNPEKLNTDIMGKNHKLFSIDDLLEQYRIDDINYCVYEKKDKNKFHKIIRKFSANGYFLPKILINKFSFAHIGFGARFISFYRAKKVMIFDPFSKKGYFVEMSKYKALKLFLKFIYEYNKVKSHYKKIKADYQNNFWQLQTESYWKKYLEIE